MKQKGGEYFLQIARRRYSTAVPTPQYMDPPSSSTDRYCFNPTLRWNPKVEEYFVKAYGADHFARISKALTHPSSYSCIRVNTLKSTSDDVIGKLMEILDEKKILTSMGNMDINTQSTTAKVDQVMKLGDFTKISDHETAETYQDGNVPLGRSQSTSILKCPYPGLDHVVFVKGSGPHKFQYGDQCGRPMKEVIVSRKCAESVLRGAQNSVSNSLLIPSEAFPADQSSVREVYVPGVLACSSHVEKGDLVAVSVAVEQPFPDNKWGFGITRGTVLQGLQSDPHYLERIGLYIGQGTALMSRAGIFRASEGVAVEMTNRIYKLPSFYDVLEGEIFLQNLPSVVTAHVLDPQEGERILDMCAAPGGKTTAIAILMKDKGEIVAIDRSHNKVMDIMKLAAEMDLTSIKPYKLDALKSVHRTIGTMNAGSTDPNDGALCITSEDSKSSNGDIISHNTEICNNDASMQPVFNSASNGKASKARYLSKADLRKNARRMRNGPGRNHCMGARVENSKGFIPNSFDRVLLDAPCSALGLRPRLFCGEETIESLQHHARYQKKMFDQAIQLVRSGGVIVYSTCTINPGENEALVRYALDKYKFLSLAPQLPRIGGPGLIGHCELFDGKYVEKWLTENEAELVQRFDPSSTVDTIGFFIAKFNVAEKDI